MPNTNRIYFNIDNFGIYEHANYYSKKVSRNKCVYIITGLISQLQL